ncbi:MAG: hypothetical protein LAP38_21085 [Acidobacteriia bacterium]|nr:hypothetical protein [Terriglobia bacterium]
MVFSGAMDGPGSVVVNGMLSVNSGYGFAGGIPGNVLLAFSVDGKQAARASAKKKSA